MGVYRWLGGEPKVEGKIIERKTWGPMKVRELKEYQRVTRHEVNFTGGTLKELLSMDPAEQAVLLELLKK